MGEDSVEFKYSDKYIGRLGRRRFERDPGQRKAFARREDHHNVPDVIEHPADRSFRKGAEDERKADKKWLIQQITDGLTQYLMDRQNGQLKSRKNHTSDTTRNPFHYETKTPGFDAITQPSNDRIRSIRLTRQEKQIVSSSRDEAYFGRRR